MKKIRDFSSSISIIWLEIGAALLFGIVVGFAISSGKTKTAEFLLLPILVLAFRIFSERIKFWLLAFSIPLSLVQIPSLPLPYGTSLSEAILVILTLDEILFPHGDHEINIKPLNPAIVISLVLFSLAGLVTNLRGGNIYGWNTYCLMPLIIFFLVSRKVHDRKDAWMLVKLSLLTIVGFIAIVEWAIKTRHFEIYDPLHETAMGGSFRLADGMIIALGPIRLTTFATRLGAIAALGLPTCVLFLIDNKGKFWWKTVLLLIIAGFGYVLILSATRGSVVAAILGSFLVILISGRFRSPIFLVIVALSLVVLTLWGETILGLFPIQNIQRLQTLLQGVQNIHNYHQRIDVLGLAWNLTLKNPLGVGFGYLYNKYLIDDAIIYAVILEGTGILGAIAFILVVGHLAFQFGSGLLKSSPGICS